MSTVFISPHDDDHALFGAFTCLRETPILVVVYDGYRQASRGLAVTAEDRMAETMRAAEILGCGGPLRLGFRDDDPTVTSDRIRARAGEVLNGLRPHEIYAPAIEEGGHAQHNTVAEAFHDRAWKQYLTYTTAGKSESPFMVPILEASWIEKKLLALACYKSQFNLDPRMGCWPHFLRNQEEYYL